jgi:hypothetical protein
MIVQLCSDLKIDSIVATAPNSVSSSPTLFQSTMEEVMVMQEDYAVGSINENDSSHFGHDYTISSSSKQFMTNQLLATLTPAPEDDSETVSTTVTSTTINDNMKKRIENQIMDADSDEDTSTSPHSPYSIQNRIQIAMERWNNVSPIPPDKFLAKLLLSRGYDTTLVSSQALRISVGPPTEKQILDYDQDILNAVRTSDLDTIKLLFESGKR